MSKKDNKIKTVETHEAAGVTSTRVAMPKGLGMRELNEMFARKYDRPWIQQFMIAIERTIALSKGTVCYSDFLRNAKFFSDALHPSELLAAWDSYIDFLHEAGAHVEFIESIDEQMIRLIL